MEHWGRFSSKAEKYARYRWDYAPEAIQAIFETTHLSTRSVLADIGAGTGILSRHFTARVGSIFAIEPNPEMRRHAARSLANYPNALVLAGCAEAIPLVSQSIDVITVAHAIHWFEPAPARREFRRVFKPGGWLALLRNYETDRNLEHVIESLLTEENGIKEKTLLPWTKEPASYYFGRSGFQVLTFPFRVDEDWQTFFGALISTSYMPDEGQQGYDNLERALRQVFDRYSTEGWIEVRGETELVIGQP